MQDRSSSPRVVHIVNTTMMLGFFTGQAGFFRAHGFVLEAVSSPGEGLAEFGRREGIAVHAVNMGRTITPLRDMATVYGLWRLLRRVRPAIVHAHTPKGGLLGMAAAWLARSPVRIYHVHGLPLLTAGGVKRVLLRLSDRVTGRFAHRVLCVGPSVERAALDEGLFPREKVRVLARGTINGVDSAARFNPAVVGREAGLRVRTAWGIPAGARVLGFVGRAIRAKGLVELAAAWRVLREKYPDLRLIVVGPFEPHDPIPEGVRECLASDPRVHLVGWVTDPAAYYAAIDVLALPTYREGFPYTLLEAASMGLPVVATMVPGCTDAVEDDVTGKLVPPRDADALAGAVAAYLEDPSLRREHGRAARGRIVREFGQQEVWHALLEEYRELLATRLGAACAPDARVVPL